MGKRESIDRKADLQVQENSIILRQFNLPHQLKLGSEELWSRSGSQGNRWVAATVEVGEYSGHTLFLEATLLADHENTYVAVDDLYAYNISCDNVDVSSLNEKLNGFSDVC